MGNFERTLAFGQIGESVISRWLQSRGHAVFPAYQVEKDTGKGPQLFTQHCDLVLPDLLAFREGKAVWFEAKHKTCFSWYRIGRRWVTGIDLRHYAEYLEVAKVTSLPVWLLFWHPLPDPSPDDQSYGSPIECPTGLFGNDLSVLVKRESHRSDRHGRSGMVYWADTSLRLLADVHEVPA
jgi:hypothetical protein